MKILAACLLNFLGVLLLQLQLCKRTQRRWLRLLPLVLPCAWFLTAAAMHIGGADALRAAAAQAYLVFGLCALLGYGAAWLAQFLKGLLSDGRGHL